VDIRFKGEAVNELFTYHIREFGLSYNSYTFKKGCSDAGATFSLDDHIGTREGKGREGKGREGKGREGKGREGKGREGKGREGKCASYGGEIGER
jgi:hypothetical protein